MGALPDRVPLGHQSLQRGPQVRGLTGRPAPPCAAPQRALVARTPVSAQGTRVTTSARYRFLLVVVAPGVTTQQTDPVPVEQIAGETRAVDLVVAYVVGGVDLVVAARLQGDEFARGYMLQQLDGMLGQAVMADPGFSFRRRAVMLPAGIGWLSTVPMAADVAAVVWALAGDGGEGPWRQMTMEDRATALAVFTAARGIAAWGTDGLLARPPGRDAHGRLSRVARQNAGPTFLLRPPLSGTAPNSPRLLRTPALPELTTRSAVLITRPRHSPCGGERSVPPPAAYGFGPAFRRLFVLAAPRPCVRPALV